MEDRPFINSHNQDIVPFWGGVYSQWADSEFTLCGITFSCAEQAMMLCKALHFGDEEAGANIMTTLSPARQKEIGRSVRGFEVESWEDKCLKYVTAISYAKFTQNPDFLREMEMDGKSWIVEASPYDKIWGIGLGEENPDVYHPDKWQGRNWLGECIMDARELIFNPTRDNMDHLSYMLEVTEEALLEDGHIHPAVAR